MPEASRKPKKSRGVGLAVLLTVIAIATVAGAVVWAGGIEGVSELLGFGTGQDIAVSPQPKPEPEPESTGEPAPVESVVTTSSAEETTTTDVGDDNSGSASAQGVFPVSAAQAAMYREQLESQTSINALVDNKYSVFTMGTPNVTASKAVVPLTATYRSGSSASGWMTISNSDGMWYFAALGTGSAPSTAKPRTVDSGVVSVISGQQATAGNQELLQTGVVQHGFVKCRVDGVTRGSGTATVNVTLLGGTLDRRAARFVLISKTDSGNKYWFVTRFELK